MFHSMAFLRSRLASCAPTVDLQFIGGMCQYREDGESQKIVADAALSSCKKHLWYLTEELVILAIFDGRNAHFWRTMMINKLKKIPRPTSFVSAKPKMPQFENTIPTLIDLIGQRSWLIFHLLRCTSKEIEWMQFESSHWEKFEDYRFLRDIINGMEVVNDSAEREVKLITDFRNVVHNEEQQQFLLQVVENHRQQVSLNGRKEQLG
ncbi:hypothetical protein OUZ56_004931 [Daphnia magna]|uniref:Uncharacterized protein n=1 Tax=Daphnia magna TaxID=35525 RepID=A0ABQ9YR99_9CRUS|nr:hypothetical protein OUZ56_004931 [Daphnia magna]